MHQKVGAWLQPDGTCRYTVWAPEAETVTLNISAPNQLEVAMHRQEFGYWMAVVKDTVAGTRYKFQLNENPERPDPASMYQPNGVHEASAIVDHQSFAWNDKSWAGIPLEKMIIYELHTGTFTDQHTFEGIISKLDYLIELGITAIEIMPVAQFPGSRNWGYDGVYPSAVQESYGGPDGLKKLVDACHEKGLAVVLDVVYNHMGPEGNYLNDFGPYFTSKYQTPWGSALNFDDKNCDGVRNFFIQNALMWFREYHIDALRLDAVHAIMDFSAKHFLLELAEAVNTLGLEIGRKFYLIAESDLNDVRVINPPVKGGFGMDGQWCDDFHHALHALVTGETDGYYHDFGKLEDLEKVMQQAFVYNGQFSPHRGKKFGSDATENPARQFVVCAQNHDQVGNRMLGERMSSLVSFQMLKPVAAAYLLSPYVPMLFMGEEYGEKNPFLYFISHTDTDLVEAVRKGRKEEFKAFKWAGEVPDPQDEATFLQSSLSWKYQDGENRELWEFYRQLIRLRKSHEVFSNLDKQNMRTNSDAAKKLLAVNRWTAGKEVLCLFNFGKEAQEVPLENNKEWHLLLDSTAAGIPENRSMAGNPVREKVTLNPESILVLEK